MTTTLRKRIIPGAVVYFVLNVIADHWVSRYYTHVYIWKHVLVADLTATVIAIVFMIYILIFCREAQHGAY